MERSKREQRRRRYWWSKYQGLLSIVGQQPLQTLEQDEFGLLFSPSGEIGRNPKKTGGKRPLGIPTVEDRIAQSAVVLCINERLDKEFHENSYAYRTGQGAIKYAEQQKQRELYALNKLAKKYNLKLTW